MDRPESRGRSRKLTEAKNIPTFPRNQIFYGESMLQLWFAVHDSLTWADRKPTEAHGSSRKPTEAKNGVIPHRIQIFPGNLVLELLFAAPDPVHGEAGSPWKLTEAKKKG